MSTKRISKEFAEVSQDPPPGYSVALPPSNSLHTWHLTLRPPPSTPFHPGAYGILLTLPVDYPFKPPSLRFLTRVYHPNVTDDGQGAVCLGLLKPENWKPSTKIAALLVAVADLLQNPLPEDPLEDAIAEEYRADRPLWETKAREHAQRYAMQEPVFPNA